MVSEPVVLIDDDKSICKTLKLHFERQGFEVLTAHFADEGMRILEKLKSAIVILDVKLPDANGIELLKEIQVNGNNYYSIIVTAFPDMGSTIKAVQNGVGEYIHKPIDIQEMDSAMEKAKEFFFSKHKNINASVIGIPPYESFSTKFRGKSPEMKELFKTIGMVSMSRETVLITGDSGTGKELVAKAIHENSAECDEPFMPINCSAIVETLLESELFGHVKGSFTGAINNKDGKFALAKRGTIFLDEISEMNINLQAKLLRVLQEREFEAVGGKERMTLNCRIISATNKDLGKMVKEGKFREDLYYRLKVINMSITELRKRREDIPDLTLFFLSKINKESRRDISSITKEAIDYLTSLIWKGNVRELENLITHVAIMSREDILTKKHFTTVQGLSADDQIMEGGVSEGNEGVYQNTKEEYSPKSLNIIEREFVKKTLEHTKWHKGRTCEILGISRPRLDRKINKYGIKREASYLG